MQVKPDSLLPGELAVQGVAAVIDVFRTFTCTPLLFSPGIQKAILVATPAEGLALKRQDPKLTLIFFTKIILITLLLSIPAQIHAYDRYNAVKKYDIYFTKYSKRFFGTGFNWHYFKAQAVAESRLKADAKSKVGAEGVMQIMPGTFKEIRRKNPAIKGNRKQPRWSIAAGIYYNRLLWKAWKAKRPFQDRVNFMFGSYNAGKRNILKAQRLAREQGLNPNLWDSIASNLPRVTRRHSGETLGYVKKINTIKEVLR